METEHVTPGQTRESVVDTLSVESGSPLQKYQDIYVGDNSLSHLIRYEFLTFFLSPIPGALGFSLRKLFYKKLFANLGRGTILGPYVTLRAPKRISLGNDVFVDNHAVLDAKGAQSNIQVGDSVLVGNSTIFSCALATIAVGNNVSIGPNCFIRASRGPVTIGSFVTVGANTVIISGNPDYRRLDIPMMKQQGQAQGVTIGDDVWIGVGARIIDGVKIGNGCVIGAGAVVTKNVPDFAIAAGVPAEVVKSRT